MYTFSIGYILFYELLNSLVLQQVEIQAICLGLMQYGEIKTILLTSWCSCSCFCTGMKVKS